jgi:shikimate dehydrogenase
VRISGTTRVCAVLGWPIAHSRSPELVNAAFTAVGLDCVMVPLGVPPDDLATVLAGLRAVRALGASVTIPHKLAALAHCDELAGDARVIGAVNCLQLVDGRWIGHNTDCTGFVDALTAAGFDRRRAIRIVLLGGGGAARAVAHGLRGVPLLEVVARRPIEGWEGVTWRPWVPDQLADAFAQADLVVDCTSIGLLEDPAQEAREVDKLPLSQLPPTAWVASLVYHRRTILLERASRAGHSIVDGRGMLVHQAAHAFAIWTGLSAPLPTMRQALDNALDDPGT